MSFGYHIICFLISVLLSTNAFSQDFDLNKKSFQRIHIFMDVATTPSLLQMVEYIKTPKEDLKIISWRRFQGYDKSIDFDKENTIEIIFSNRETGIHLNGNYVASKVHEIYKRFPNALYTIHANDKHFYVHGVQLLSFIPKKQIEMIHLYEDGNATKFRYYRDEKEFEIPSVEDLKQQIIAEEKKSYYPYDLVLSHLYPVTYHVFFLNKMREQNSHERYLKAVSKGILINVDYAEIGKNLSDTDRKKLFRLAGFDYDQLNTLFSKKKNIVITLPYLKKDSETFQSMTRVIGFLMIDGFNIINPDDYTFFYKPHPSLSNYEGNKTLSTLFPEMVFLPRRLPYELLILGNLNVNYVVGTLSSLFFTLKPNQILKWFFEKNYYPPLLYSKIITDEQEIDLKKVMDFLNKNGI